MSEKYKIVPHHFFVAVGTSCKIPHNQELDKEVKFMGEHIDEEAKAGRQLYPRSYMLYQFERCLLQNDRLEKIVDRLPAAVKRITKRTLIDSMYKDGIVAAKVVKAMATIWLNGSSKMVLMDTAVTFAKSLLKTIVDDAFGSYNKTAIVPPSLNKDEILAISKNVAKYPHLLEQVVAKENYFEKYLDYNQNEMSAGEVLLLAIEESLKRGRLDTKALGELVNDEELSAIDPEAMHVISVTSKNQLLQFIAEEIIERTFSERIVWTDVIAVGGLFILVLLLGVAAYAYKRAVRRDEKTRATVEQIQLSTLGGTASHVPLVQPTSGLSQFGSRGNVERNSIDEPNLK